MTRKKLKCPYLYRVSISTLFVTALRDGSGRFNGIKHVRQLLITSVSAISIALYVKQKLEDDELAHSVASRNGFAGADSRFMIA